jgi:DMSO/TMAO reductase YedYZ molybdopterin-dependent catalytic subunit
MPDEVGYDRLRLTQWLNGHTRADGLSRRGLLRLSAGVGLAAIPGLALGSRPATAAPAGPATAPVAAAGPIVKPLPPELFYNHGFNAEMRWEAMSGQGYLVPVDRFFVRDHISTPLVDADTWRLRLFGDGLHGAPTLEPPIELSYRQLRDLPAESVTAFVECAGNGRSFYTTQQNEAVSGTAWRLGAIGVARWRGVRLSTVLRRAGLARTAVDVMAQGLDPTFVSGGVDLGHVRRPLPVHKAMHDVLLRLRDERPDAAARPRLPGTARRAVLGRHLLHQMGGPDRGIQHRPVLTLEHPVLPALRPGLPDRRRTGLPPGRQERVRTALGRPAGRRPAAPAARAVLVRQRTRPPRRGQHRRR